MDVLTPDRLMTLVGFIGLLLLIWFVVRLKSGAPLRQFSTQDAQLDVVQIRVLGDGARAILMRAAGHDVLVIAHRKTGAQLVHLSAESRQIGPQDQTSQASA